MCPQSSGSHYGVSTKEAQIEKLYLGMIEGWSQRDAQKFSAAFDDNGTMIGLDGMPHKGAQQIEEYTGQIFREPGCSPSLIQVKSLRMLTAEVALLEAMVGMTPSGAENADPQLHAYQVMTAVRSARRWGIIHLQSTLTQPQEQDDTRVALKHGYSPENYSNFN